jgi:hypothetical protein
VTYFLDMRINQHYSKQIENVMFQVMEILP